MIIIFVGLLLFNNYLVSMERSIFLPKSVTEQIDAKTTSIIEKASILFPHYTKEQLIALRHKLNNPYEQMLLMQSYLHNTWLQYHINKHTRVYSDNLVHTILNKRDKIHSCYASKKIEPFLDKWQAIPLYVGVLKLLERQFYIPKEIIDIIANYMSDSYTHPFNNYTREARPFFGLKIVRAQSLPSHDKFVLVMHDRDQNNLDQRLYRCSIYNDSDYDWFDATLPIISKLHFCSDEKMVLASANNISVGKMSWWRSRLDIIYETPNNDICTIHSLDKNTLVLASSCAIYIHDIKQRTHTSFYSSSAYDYIFCLDVSPDKKYIAAGCADGTVKIWDSKTKELYNKIDAYKTPTQQIKFCNANHIIVGNGYHQIKIFDLNTLACTQEINEADHTIAGFDISADGNFVAVLGKDRNYITIYDRNDKNKYVHQAQDKKPISLVHFTGNTLLYTQKGQLIIKSCYNGFEKLQPRDKMLLQFLDK